jgi:uncharacterized protein (TIGR02453 family)
MPWYVYLVRCADGTLYTGVTTDLEDRERTHNRGRGAAYTRSRLPVAIVHAEPALDRGAALRRELAIKGMTRRSKEALVAGVTTATRFEAFRPEALRFLRGLERNNRRDWFERHRPTYEREIRDPMRALVEEMDVRLARLAPELVGDPKRSIFRIHRDVRFSADKSPYKTAQGAVLSDDTGRVYYVALSTEGIFAASGYYMMAKDQIDRFRKAVASEKTGPPVERTVAKLEKAGYEIGGEALRRAPAGYPVDHPRIRLLRHKGMTMSRSWEPAPWVGTAAAKTRVVAVFRAATPLNDWLDVHVGRSKQSR